MTFRLLLGLALLGAALRIPIPDALNAAPAILSVGLAFAATRRPSRPALSSGVRPAAPSWIRAPIFLASLVLAVEYGARCGGYHRTVRYERKGDLLFTPVPDQQAMEKISLTRSRINNLGLRGPDVSPADLKRTVVLCLGDSITYGYGVSDADTYPARLQAELERVAPGRFLVLNGGVNAYPVSFMTEKLRYLKASGLTPSAVVVGYSMNEGWLAGLTSADSATKDAFERRVRLKNFLRSIALYNLIVENWARHAYDRMKGHLVPGTHAKNPAAISPEERYKADLAAIVAEIRHGGATPVFVAFASYNPATDRHETAGSLQQAFIEFAKTNGLHILQPQYFLNDTHGSGAPAFLDASHLSPVGSAILAEHAAQTLLSLPELRSR